MSSLDQLAEVLLLQIKHGLTVAFAPQAVDVKTLKTLLDEWTKETNLGEDDSRIALLKEFIRCLEGDVDDQLVLANQALQQNPDDPEIWCHLGVMSKRKGMSRIAEACYKQALSINPNSINTNYNYANLLRGERRLDEALTYYRDCLRIEPKDFNARHNMAITLLNLGRLEEAEYELSKVVEIFPVHYKAYNSLGLVYLEKGDLASAEKQFEEALKIEPNYTTARNNLSLIRQKTALGRGEPFGQAQIIGTELKIGGGNYSCKAMETIGGANFNILKLSQYTNYRFDVEWEEVSVGCFLIFSYLERERPEVVMSLPFPIITDEGKMNISGPVRPESEQIDIEKIKVIQFNLVPHFSFRGLSPIVWIKNFALHH